MAHDGYKTYPDPPKWRLAAFVVAMFWVKHREFLAALFWAYAFVTAFALPVLLIVR